MTIDELRELGERATKGPWRSIDHDQDEWWMYAFGVGPALVSYQPDDSTAFARSEADVALIAAARTHWDALLAIAEAADVVLHEFRVEPEGNAFSTAALADLRSALDALTPKEDDK